MGLNIRRERNIKNLCMESDRVGSMGFMNLLNRINAQEMKLIYNSNQVSLNDGLDIFYKKIVENEPFDHEMQWIFHTELLSSKKCAALHVKDELEAEESDDEVPLTN